MNPPNLTVIPGEALPPRVDAAHCPSYTSCGFVYVGTVTVSLRLPESEVSRLESTAQALGVDRSTLLRWAVRRGASALLLECACDAYRRGDVTLSRAAEIAGLSLRDMILKLRDQDVELNYGPEDLAADLQPL